MELQSSTTLAFAASNKDDDGNHVVAVSIDQHTDERVPLLW